MTQQVRYRPARSVFWTFRNRHAVSSQLERSASPAPWDCGPDDTGSRGFDRPEPEIGEFSRFFKVYDEQTLGIESWW